MATLAAARPWPFYGWAEEVLGILPRCRLPSGPASLPGWGASGWEGGRVEGPWRRVPFGQATTLSRPRVEMRRRGRARPKQRRAVGPRLGGELLVRMRSGWRWRRALGPRLGPRRLLCQTGKGRGPRGVIWSLHRVQIEQSSSAAGRGGRGAAEGVGEGLEAADRSLGAWATRRLSDAGRGGPGRGAG